MGYIKEPTGIDFIIKSEPLTNEERAAISEFILQFKAKHSAKNAIIKRRTASSKKKKDIISLSRKA
ncbi:MAG: hypothetical protein JWQ09_1214 [Segetibacter sp.]|nr:hypothetical protein [Segetibacter sp.]